MPTCHNGLPYLNGNIMCAIDTETTGLMPGYHEIIQIAVQPLDANLEPAQGLKPFYHNIAPDYPERAQLGADSVHGIDVSKLQETALPQWRVADLFDEWFQALDLPLNKSIVPLAHNWAFEAGFLKSWLGLECVNMMFHPHPRDSMLLAIAINDRALMRGDPIVFKTVSLVAMCKQLGINMLRAHDALSDSLAGAKVYQALMRTPIW